MGRVGGPIDGAATPGLEVVIRALDNCHDPCCRDRKISVVDMGLIESIEIRDREVSIEMVLTTGWCPFASRLLGMVEEEVGSLPGVDSVDVEVVWDPTWTPERMSTGAREKLRLPLERLEPLREARMREARMREARMREARMREARMREARMRGESV